MLEGFQKDEGLENVLAGSESRENISKNVVIIERPEARYRITYQVHSLKFEHPEKIIENTDALALEFIGEGIYRDPQRAFDEYKTWERVEMGGAGNADVWRLVEAKGIPLYFLDVSVSDKQESLGIIDRDKWRHYEEAIGVGALLAMLQRRRDGDVSRRSFLKNIVRGGAAVYFLGFNVLEDIANDLTHRGGTQHPDEGSIARSGDRALIHTQEALHPELNAVDITLRNALFAQKLTTIARDMGHEFERKPEIGIIVGSRHVGIEQMLAVSDEKRVKIIVDIVHALGAEGIQEHISKIAELKFDQVAAQWQQKRVFDDPMLAKEFKRRGQE